MYRISYRFLVPGWSAKPLVSAHDRIVGTHTAPGGPDWAMLPVEKLAEARDDPRWDVTSGFLDAWLAREPTERWTAVGFDAPSLSVEYDSWEFTGVGGPAAVPGTGIEVVPADFEATANSTTRSYRAFVAVVADSTGRWTVNAVGHRRPS